MAPESKLPPLLGHVGIDVYRLARAGRFDLAREHVQREIDRRGLRRICSPGADGTCPFELWAVPGHEEILRWLEPHGIPWNVRFAAQWGRVDVLETLDRERAPLDLLDGRGHDALYHALWRGQLDAAEWLTAHGFDLGDPHKSYAMAAVRSRDPDVVRWSVERGCLVDGGPDNGRTALHHECNHGWTKLVPVLLELGADPNRRDRFHHGGTALHLAAQRGNATRLAGLLLDAGADPTLRDDRGDTPLDAARRASNGALAELLEARS